MVKNYYNDSKISSTYKEYILKVAKLMMSTNKNLTSDIDKMFELEKSLALVITQINRLTLNFY